jgi:very-short-patch-repair endonuclease
VTNRDQRDRDLQVAGFTVIHFSYSELVEDPRRCVGEVLSIAGDQRRELSERVFSHARGGPDA